MKSIKKVPDPFTLDSDIEETIRQSITRDRPLGNPGWTDEMIEKYKLEKTTRPRGRPKKK